MENGKNLCFGWLTEEEVSYYTNDYTRHLGAVCEEIRPGYCRMSLELKPEMCNPMGFAHAGIVFAMMDSAVCTAGVFFAEDKMHSLVTQSTDVHYLRIPKGKRIIVEGKLMKAGRTTGYATAEAHDEFGNLTVCSSTELFFTGTMVRGQGSFIDGIWKQE